MDESGGTQDDDSTDLSRQPGPRIVPVVPDGDVILDVTFNTSKETLKLARKAAQSVSARKPASGNAPLLRPQVRVAYRVKLAVLRQHSVYFENLLSDTRFVEGRTVTEAFEKLSLHGTKAEDAEPADLPWVKIVDDDEATRSAGRDAIFGDLLKILHGVENAVKVPTSMHYVAVLTVLADRFVCLPPVSRYLFSKVQFKWPAERVRPSGRDRDGDRVSAAHEENLRQKILVAWLLNRPPNFHAATRDLIMTGSIRWSPYPDLDSSTERATWWDLQDDIERELQYRRECILNTIASVISHFLKLYTSRNRQCRLGYDSSAACDSYQLGEMIRFLTSRRLLYLVDFSPLSIDQVPDSAGMDISEILATLKQCSSYQIDKNHTNCGLRTRMLPIVEYIEACLGQYCVGLVRQSWAKDRDSASWVAEAEAAEREGKKKPFRLTRAATGDPRLRFADALGRAHLGRALFTASSWDWTPEE
ncbi:hypothetical protein BR93DRAFT_927432 [Coniochaeta sp. PMI_546]|nr:hypothetical protein BR93DRAFT_927432 [Coniochaeta sp. PMI_546]